MEIRKIDKEYEKKNDYGLPHEILKFGDCQK
jgi:hypothetical protein